MVVLWILSALFAVIAYACPLLAGRTSRRFGVWANLHVWVRIAVGVLALLASLLVNPNIIRHSIRAESINDWALVYWVVFGTIFIAVVMLFAPIYLIGRYLLHHAVPDKALRFIDSACARSSHPDPSSDKGDYVPSWKQPNKEYWARIINNYP